MRNTITVENGYYYDNEDFNTNKINHKDWEHLRWIEGIGTTEGIGLFSTLMTSGTCGGVHFDLSSIRNCYTESVLYLNTETDTVCYCQSSVGVKGVKELEGVAVYPNPTTGKLRIKNEELRVNNVEIFDIYGRNVIPHTSYPSPLATMNISHLQPGIYFVRIQTENGAAVKKVIKQ